MTSEILSAFSPRDIAVLVWIGILICWMVLNKRMRPNIAGLFKAFFQWSIVLMVLASICYSVAWTYVFSEFGLWTIKLTKDAVYWYLGSAFITLFNLSESKKDDKFFRKLVLDNFKLMVLLQFISNVHSFSLTGELFFVPIIAFIGMTAAYAEYKSDDKSVIKLLNSILAITGITLFILSVRDIYESEDFFSSGTLQSFIFPILMSLAFIPFAYGMTLFMNYETLFIRLKILLGNEENYKYARMRVMTKCHLRLKKLRTISTSINELYRGSTKENIDKVIS